MTLAIHPDPDANSYASRIDADAYFANIMASRVQSWGKVGGLETDGDKDLALQTATQDLNRVITPLYSPNPDNEHALLYPSGTDTLNPDFIIQATVVLADYLGAGFDPYAASASNGQDEVEVVGVVRVKYSRGDTPPNLPREVMALLRGNVASIKNTAENSNGGSVARFA